LEKEENFDLKAELKSIGMTQKDFAEHIKRTPNTINRWVKGEVEIPEIIKLYLQSYRKAKLYDEITFKIV
jgi:transcriptional regulator with XRE-family HTH domain